jgi:hypothetical protein
VPSTDERPRKRQEREGDVRHEGVRGGGHPVDDRLPRYDDSRWVL